MKNGTLYAKRIRKLFSQLRKEHGPVEVPADQTNPIEELVVGVLSTESTRSRAIHALKALLGVMVDINEIRVSTPREIAEVIKSYVARSRESSERVLGVLESVYRKEHGVTLDRLHQLGRREAKQYLESIVSINPNSVASVMQWSLGAHAIPLTIPVFEALRADDLVEPTADISQVQSFLERNIAAGDAREFCELMEKYVAKQRSRSSGNSSGKKKTTAGKSSRKKAKASKTKASKSESSSRKSPAKKKKRATKR